MADKNSGVQRMDLILEDASLSALITEGPCGATNHSIRHFSRINKAIWDFPLKITNFMFQNKKNSFIYLHILPQLLPRPKWLTCKGQAGARSRTQGYSVILSACKSGLRWHRGSSELFLTFWCFSISSQKTFLCNIWCKMWGIYSHKQHKWSIFKCYFTS